MCAVVVSVSVSVSVSVAVAVAVVVVAFYEEAGNIATSVTAEQAETANSALPSLLAWMPSALISARSSQSAVTRQPPRMGRNPSDPSPSQT